MSELIWRKASASANNGCCVECAALPDGGVAMRDSKNDTHDRLVLKFTRAEWTAFADAMAHGEFDYLLGAFKGFGPPPALEAEKFGPLPPIMAVPLDTDGVAPRGRPVGWQNWPVC